MKKLFTNILAKRAAPLIITLAILLVSVLAALAADSIEQRHALRMDFSFNSVTTQSEQTQRVLQTLNTPVHAYAIFTPGQEDQALLGLLNRFAASTPMFSYSVENLVSNPLLVNLLSSQLEDEEAAADSLVLRCEATKRTRVLNMLDFLDQRYDENQGTYLLTGLRYEAAIAEALIYVTMPSVPGIRILDGHGEITAAETAEMEDLLKTHHYQVSRVNLLQGDELDPKELLLVLSPQKDLQEAELEMLLSFTKAGGALIITSDYGDPDSLPLFDALYRGMGFVRIPGIAIAQSEDKSAYIDNPVFLTPYMEMTEPTAALIGAGQTRLRLPGARAFDMLQGDGTLLVDPLLISGQAFIKDVKRAEVTLKPEENDRTGQFYLALLSDRAHPDGTHSRGMILGSSAILLDSWLYQITYSAEFLLRMASYLSPQESISLDIAPKQLVRPELSISQPWLPNLLLILLPLALGAAAVPVLLSRRKR